MEIPREVRNLGVLQAKWLSVKQHFDLTTKIRFGETLIFETRLWHFSSCNYSVSSKEEVSFKNGWF